MAWELKMDKKLDEERGKRMAKLKEEMSKKKELIPLSQTTLDLILGGDSDSLGIYPNDIVNLVGDSGSGKTAVATQMIYEISGYINAGLSEEYSSATHLVLDGENGNKFSTEKMFGFSLNTKTDVKTIEGVFSELMLAFKANTTKNKGKITGKNLNIIVIDSLDSFASEATLKQGEDRVKAYEKDKDYNQGTFALEKNRYLSTSFFPTIVPELQGSDTLLIIVSQVRDKIGVTFGSKLQVTGGKALQFYCTYRVLIAEAEKLKKTVKGEKYDIGKLLKFKTLKVRSAKPYRTCFNVTFYEVGMDNVFSNVLYLYDLITDTGKVKDDASSRNLSWTGGDNSFKEDTKENIYEFLSSLETTIKGLTKSTSKKKMMEFIDSDETVRAQYEEVFGTGMDIEALTQYIYENDLEEDLHNKVLEKWNSIEDQLAIVGRKKKW